VLWGGCIGVNDLFFILISPLAVPLNNLNELSIKKLTYHNGPGFGGRGHLTLTIT